jgi:hypothetical protein
MKMQTYNIHKLEYDPPAAAPPPPRPPPPPDSISL